MNIHKGYSPLNARFILHELREAIRQASPDIVFLQEVQGEHTGRAEKHEDWPDQSQFEFLADEVWTDYAYGQNSIYPKGHHGNALLSRFPILDSEQMDISTNRVEQRGLLWCELELPDQQSLHCVCVHLGLSAISRRKQLAMVHEYVGETMPDNEPLVVAGDFNDWTGRPTKKFAENLGLKEAFKITRGRHARSFPARGSFLKLDRIYLRGLNAVSSQIYSKGIWGSLSDHAALAAELEIES